MNRTSVTLLALIFSSTAAIGFRSRPISDLRFDDRPSLYIAGAASDGSDFLLLGTSNGHVFVQSVVSGALAGSQHTIAVGKAGRIVWASDHYLVSWVNDNGLFVAPLSSAGNLIFTPVAPVLKSPKSLFAASTTSAIAVGGGVVQPLDLMGHPIWSASTLPTSSTGVDSLDDLAPAGDGFVLAFSGYSRTSVLRLRGDGTPVMTTPAVVEGPYSETAPGYHSYRAIIAGDAAHAVVLFEAGNYNSDTELKSAIIDANGNLSRAPQRVYSMAGALSLNPAAMIRNGSEYVVVIGVSHDPTGNFADVDPALLTLDSNGQPIGDLNYVLNSPRRQAPTALASNGRELLVPWYDTTNQDFYGYWMSSVPLASMKAGPPQQIGRSLDAQTNLAIGAMNGQYLAAWIETTADTRTVRASRLDASGNYLDGTGIILSATPVPPQYSYAPTVAIDSDGKNWFVVWADGSVHGAMISTTGALVSSGSITLGRGDEAAVRWNGSNYLVVFSDSSLYSVPVSRDGNAGARTTLAVWQGNSDASLSFRSPSLASLHGQFLVTFAAHSYSSTEQTSVDDVSAVGLRLAAGGTALDAAPFTIGHPMWSGRAPVETDGNRFLVVWPRGEDVAGAFLSGDAPQQGGSVFTIDAKASLPAAAFDGHDFVVASVRWAQSTIATTRVSGGVPGTPTVMRLVGSERVATAPSITATASTPALIAFNSVDDAYGGVSRGATLFASEIGDTTTALNAPAILGATSIGDDMVAVRWLPVHGALGIAIELRFEDGTYREIGVAPGGAVSARAALAGMKAAVIRIRAWNSAGLSIPSTDVPILIARGRAVQH